MKIYDCFTFFNELDILEMRLNILNNYVDFFVLVEATKTHSGQKKELYFENNKSRFKEFSDKIIHIIVDDMPEINGNNRWVLENFQREAIMRGLARCEQDDIIMISDLDEIMNLKNLDYFKKALNLNSKKNDLSYNLYFKLRGFLASLKSNFKILKLIIKVVNHFYVKSNKMVIFKQNMYYYYFNGFINNNWFGPRAVLYEDLVKQFKSSPQQIRNSFAETVIENGGWHFSYLFSPEEISEKIKSFAHSEYDKPDFTSTELIRKRILEGEDLFGRKEKINYVKIDDSYPEYIINNLEKYSLYINQNYSNNV